MDAIHDEGLNPGEPAGRARDTSLEGALARVENRLACGMTEDVLDLAAMQAVAVATRHRFDDADTRPALRTMNLALELTGGRLPWEVAEVGPLIVEAAQGRTDEGSRAQWPRRRAEG